MALEIKHFQAILASKENPDVYNDQIENISKEQNPSENPDDAQEKTEAVVMVRGLFGSVLFLSLQRKVDMAEVFYYPLTPVPLSLCYTDGTILKSPKAKLLTELESRVKSEAPTKIDAAVVDGMFFLHLLVDPPKTFKQIAIYLLRKMFNSFNCKNIHLVFDKVVSPSIKDLERST